MKRFSNIVFVSESEENDKVALQQAIKLAKSNHALLTVVACIDEPRSFNFIESKSNQFINSMVDAKKEELNLVLNQLNYEHKAEIKVLIGKPFIKIIQEVLKHDRNLIIKPAEKPKGISQVVFGGLDFKLLRKCPCPVWLINSNKPNICKVTVVAIDKESDNVENELINNQLLSMASSLATRERGELHVVHIWELPHEEFLRSTRMQNTDEEVDKMVCTEERERKKWLEKTVNSNTSIVDHNLTQDIQPQLHLIKGEAKYDIPKLTKEVRADLIVMGTVGRSGIPGYVIGNTAETILNGIDCSVLAIKPKGFISPVSID